MSKTPKSFFLVPRFFLFSFSCFFQRSLLIIKPYGKSLKSENTTKYLKSMLVATAKFHPKETPHSQHQSPCEFLDVKFASMSHRPVSCLPCRMSCVMPRVRGGVYRHRQTACRQNMPQEAGLPVYLNATDRGRLKIYI